jgi:ATP-dependent Lon protease
MKASYLKPLLPLRDIVIFPSMVVPLFVGREKSIKALQEVMKADKSIVLVTQKNSEIDNPTGKDLFQYGCLSKVLQLLKLPDGTVKVLVEGEKRVKIVNHNDTSNNFLTCEVEIAEDQNITKDLDPLAQGLIKKFDRLQVLSKKDLNDGSNNLKNLKSPSEIANNISSRFLKNRNCWKYSTLKKD